MVLHHVAQRAVLVVIGPAVADADRFSDRDLHMVDGQIVPQRFEDGVAEAQGDQVLHRLLAEVVIDAEHLPFVKGVGHGVIDFEEALQVAADRLLQHDAIVLLGQTCRLHGRDDAAVERGRHRQEGGRLSLARPRLQRAQALGVGGVHRQIVEAGGQALPTGLVPGAVGLGAGPHRLAHLGDVLLGGFLRPGGADDLQLRRQEPVVIQEVERRQKHPHGQVAAAAEQDQSRHLGPPSQKIGPTSEAVVSQSDWPVPPAGPRRPARPETPCDARAEAPAGDRSNPPPRWRVPHYLPPPRPGPSRRPLPRPSGLRVWGPGRSGGRSSCRWDRPGRGHGWCAPAARYGPGRGRPPRRSS
uniref:Secreted protein n=1 Tax=Parastrongyloides trichosuri TaxID=131310 RepID=A0A0N4ZKZ0_PARTI